MRRAMEYGRLVIGAFTAFGTETDCACSAVNLPGILFKNICRRRRNSFSFLRSETEISFVLVCSGDSARTYADSDYGWDGFIFSIWKFGSAYLNDPRTNEFFHHDFNSTLVSFYGFGFVVFSSRGILLLLPYSEWIMEKLCFPITLSFFLV